MQQQQKATVLGFPSQENQDQGLDWQVDEPVQTLLLKNITVDFALQPRTGIRKDTVAEYRDAILEGSQFPPLLVYHIGDGMDQEARLLLADGFHRYYAALDAGLAEFDCIVRQGSRQEALKAAITKNSAHGLRFTRADKRKAVTTLLKDPEMGLWSDRQIAEFTGTSHPFVSGLRAELLHGKRKGNEQKEQSSRPSRDLGAEVKRLGRQVERLKAENKQLKVENDSLKIEVRKYERQLKKKTGNSESRSD
jgi:ParB-like chromosome segregation protein Spo0J